MKNNIWPTLAIIGQVGLIIAIPVSILAYFGHKLDLRFHTSPLFLLAGMGLSLLLSSLAIYQMIKKIENK
jgi:F0F1-type ATP synthase assembly protein I